MKWNILRCLVQVGCKVTVLPGTATAEDVLAHKPDGIFLSNGPGDPEPLTYAIDTIRDLVGKKPIFGICLGHQLLGLALGGEDVQAEVRPSRRQSAGAESADRQGRDHDAEPRLRGRASTTLPPDLEPTHINLNDSTLEGMRHTALPAVQRAVSPRGVGRPARQQLSVRGVSQADGIAKSNHENTKVGKHEKDNRVTERQVLNCCCCLLLVLLSCFRVFRVFVMEFRSRTCSASSCLECLLCFC